MGSMVQFRLSVTKKFIKVKWLFIQAAKCSKLLNFKNF